MGTVAAFKIALARLEAVPHLEDLALKIYGACEGAINELQSASHNMQVGRGRLAECISLTLGSASSTIPQNTSRGLTEWGGP